MKFGKLQHNEPIMSFMMSTKQFIIRLGIFASCCVFADQAAKFAAVARLGAPIAEPTELLWGFLRLTLVRNKGVAFGLLGGPDDGYRTALILLVQLTILTLLILAAVRLTDPFNMFLLTALSLIVGGAAGNSIDRLRCGFVIDFIEMDLGFYVWPAYNLADAFITVGVILWLIEAVRKTPDV